MSSASNHISNLNLPGTGTNPLTGCNIKGQPAKKTISIFTFIHRLAVLLLLFILPAHSFTQAYEYKRFGPAQGLNDGFVYTILEDSAGFLWMGTGKGLYRFDGKKFKAFTQRDGLAEDFVTTSFTDRNGNLWFGHNKGSVTLVKNGVFKKYLSSEMLSSTITSIMEDDWGNIWIASQRDGFIKIDRQGKLTPFREIAKGSLVYSTVYMGKAKFVLGTSDGCFVYRIKSGTASPELSHRIASIPNTRVMEISKSRNGYWITTEDEGIFHFKPGIIAQNDTVVPYNSQKGFPEENNTSILEEPNGNLCIGTNGWSLLRFTKDNSPQGYHETKNTNPTDSLGKENIRCLFQDRFGQIWIGTYGLGAICVSPQKFTLYETAPGNEKTNYQCLVEDAGGNFWIGTDKGLHFSSAEKFPEAFTTFTIGNKLPLPVTKTFLLRNGLPEADIHALLEFPQGTLWIGTNSKGLCRMETGSGKISVFDLGGQDLTNHINDLVADGNGNIWVATRGGAFIIDPLSGKTEFFSTQNGLPHNHITDLYVDANKKVWLASHSHRAAYFSGKGFVSVGVEAENVVPDINCITQDRQGNFWFGTDGAGIIRYDGKTFKSYTTEEGLLSDFVYSIHTDAGNTIWASHRNGISRVVPSTNKVIQYNEKESFPVKDTDLNYCAGDSKGNIWYCTPAGLLRFNPGKTEAIENPPFTMLTSFQVFDEDKPLVSGLQLPYEKYRIKFEFLGLTLLNQEDVRYQYKLEGNDIDWSDITSSTEVTYQGLAHGDYTFMVRASNRFGVWNKEPVVFSFSIAPPFWATWWFQIAAAFGLALLILLFIRYRIYRFRKEKEFLEQRINERTTELRLEKEKLETAYKEIQKLSLAVSETSNAILILDKNGYLEWVNKGLTRMTGFSLEELKRLMADKKFLDSSTYKGIDTLLSEAVENNKPVSYESVVTRKDGSQVFVLSTLTPIMDADGKLLNIAIIDSDISDRKKAEQEIREMNQNLERLVKERTQELAVANEQLKTENIEHIKTAEKLRLINQELDTFIYRASHDLKGPLASLIGLVGLSRAEVKDPGALRYIDLMERSAMRLDDILLNLLEATSIRQTTPEISKVNLRETVETVLKAIASRPDAGKASFLTEIPENFFLQTDGKLLGSALQNLVDNSIKFSDPLKDGVKVSIRAEKANNVTRIIVSDNGRGIPQDQKDKVFDMFFRGDLQTKGTGLGLYIVKNIVDKLDGDIHLESEPGTGTTIVLELPDMK